MITFRHVVSTLQLEVALVVFPLFFFFVPWATSRAVSGLFESQQQQFRPPEWAKYYSMNHGTYTYYRTSPREEPVRAILHGGALAGCCVFLIWSGFHDTSPEDRNKSPETGDRSRCFN